MDTVIKTARAIFCFLMLAFCCTSCIAEAIFGTARLIYYDVQYELTHYANEPYYSVSCVKDGIEVYEEFYSANDIHFDVSYGELSFIADIPYPVFLNFSVSNTLNYFVKGDLYYPRSGNAYTMNKYGHYCYSTTSSVSFEKNKDKKEKSYLVRFEGDFLDPDSEKTIRITDGCITVFRNADVGYHDRDAYIRH